MRLDRLVEEQQKLEEIVKYADLLDDDDKALLEKKGVKAYKELFDIEYKNLFFAADEFEKENPIAKLVRVFRDPVYMALACKHILNIDLPPYQVVILQELERRKYPMLVGSRGLAKSFLLAVYGIWTMLFKQGSNIVITGSGFRQSKIVFNYMNTIWRSAPILRDIVGGGKQAGPKYGIDVCYFYIGDSITQAIPVGDGQKIRGMRASVLINDEFGALSKQVYEQVISGFASVNKNPVQGMKNKARIEVLKCLKMWKDEENDVKDYGNQSILSGTADYSFKHFAEYWRQYKAIIQSRGDPRKIDEIFPEGAPPEFNWKHYSIIRMPFELIPKGFMDEEHVARSKATAHTALYQCEFGAIFVQDSDGFYKRTLIEGCVCGDDSIIQHTSCGRVIFDAVLHGHPNRWYVIAIDPASEKDNFAITVLECWPEHRRVVYCWTINKKKYYKLVQKGLVTQKDFYAYCARKIRDLMNIFPCERITMDSQGGGYAIAEALHDDKDLMDNELPIFEVIDENNPKPTDDYEGLHILELVMFSDADWRYNANHFLKKDMEDKVLLFPRYNPVVVSLAIEKDRLNNRVDDQGEYLSAETLEDVIFEIEEMKNELTTIEHSVTATGLDKWDTPEIKLIGSKKGRLKKDRYTALLMANMAARTIQRAPVVEESEQIGFSVREIADANIDMGKLYNGPAWYQDVVGGALVLR